MFLDSATAEEKDFLARYHAGSLRVPEDVKELTRLCKLYRRDALLNKYRTMLLIEYILAVLLESPDSEVLLPLARFITVCMEAE